MIIHFYWEICLQNDHRVRSIVHDILVSGIHCRHHSCLVLALMLNILQIFNQMVAAIHTICGHNNICHNVRSVRACSIIGTHIRRHIWQIIHCIKHHCMICHHRHRRYVRTHRLHQLPRCCTITLPISTLVAVWRKIFSTKT